VSRSLLTVKGLRAGYGQIEALHGVDLTVCEGEAVTIIGANGAGKTTLLRTIAGLLRPRAGQVWLGDKQLTGRPAEVCVREGVCLVPEGRQVFAELPVHDNLLLGAFHRRREDLTGDFAKVYELFPRLSDRRGQLAGTLSGGEQQMLAIGRGLLSQPRMLLLDEPSLGLAPIAVREVSDQLVTLVAQGMTVLLVEQNARAALRVATRGYVLAQGEVIADCPTTALMEDPRVRSAYLGGTAGPGTGM